MRAQPWSRTTASRVASRVGIGPGLAVEPGDPDAADLLDPLESPSRRRREPATTAPTPDSIKPIARADHAAPGDLASARPTAADRFIERFEPRQARGQLDRVVVAHVGKAEPHEDVGRQLLAEPEGPAIRRQLLAEPGDHRRLERWISAANRRIETEAEHGQVEQASGRAERAESSSGHALRRRRQAASAASTPSSTATRP